MRKIPHLGGYALGLAIVGGMLFLYWLRPDFLQTLDARLLDIKFRLRGPIAPSGAVVIVAVDKKSTSAVGRWPWPRKVIAEMINFISEGNPRVVGLDFLFYKPSRSPGSDTVLEEAIRNCGCVVGASLFYLSPEEARYQPQKDYERNLATLESSTVGVIVNLKGEERDFRALTAYGVEANIEPIASVLSGSGFFNVTLDRDGAVRRAPLIIKAAQGIYYSFAIAVLKTYLRADNVTLTLLGEFVEQLAVGPATVPTDSRGRLFLNYYGPQGIFETYSAADLLAGRVPKKAFRDRIVLVGGTSLGEFDTLVTPFSPKLSSIAIQATCVENILMGNYLRESMLSIVLTVCAIVFYGLLLALLLPRLRSVLLGGGLFLACLAGFIVVNLWLFGRQNVQASTIYPLMTIAVSYVAVSLYANMLRERKSERLRRTLAGMSETMDSILDIGELLPKMLDSIVDYIGAERGMLLVQEGMAEEGNQLIVKAKRNMGATGWESDDFFYGREIITRVAKIREGVIITRFRLPRKRKPSVEPDGYVPASLLCVPLKVTQRLVGIIYADKQAGGDLFDRRDMEIIGSFASHWAIAIENAGLYSMLKESDARLREENIYLKKEVSKEERFQYIIGGSPAMQPVFNLIEKAIDSSITVLVEGETGTGKELVARTIHFAGERKESIFVAQNCASLPETLLESELFGHVKGSFTGATTNKKGLFEVADGGTIFLDEIGEMPPGMQSKLLRVLAEGTIRPVGGVKEKKVDVRVISATNRDLAEEVKKGRFREDLLYRLNVFPIRIPPLRDRKEDISSLALFFLKKYGEKLDKRVKGFSVEAMGLLGRYDWPGNIRELENEIERAIALISDGEIITSELISEKLKSSAAAASLLPVPGVAEMGLKEAVGHFESRIIAEVLRKCGGNRTLAAKKLGITRQSLQHKIKIHHLD